MSSATPPHDDNRSASGPVDPGAGRRVPDRPAVPQDTAVTPPRRSMAEERRLIDEGQTADERDLAGRHAAAPAGAAAAAGVAGGVRTSGATDTDARTGLLPEPPPRPGAGRHFLGTLLGLALTPVALLLIGIGTARLADVAVADEAMTDVLGLTLLIVGVVLLAVIVLLGAWSPMVPIAGGLVWGIGLGVAFLVVPTTMSDRLEGMSADNVVPGGVEQLAENAMSGSLLVTGTLLVAAGIAAARARRRGRRWAEGVAAAREARTEARAVDHRGVGPRGVDDPAVDHRAG